MDAVVAKYFTADDFPTGALQVDIVVQGVFAGRQNSGPTWDLYRCKECAALTDTPEQHATWHEAQAKINRKADSAWSMDQPIGSGGGFEGQAKRFSSEYLEPLLPEAREILARAKSRRDEESPQGGVQSPLNPEGKW